MEKKKSNKLIWGLVLLLIALLAFAAYRASQKPKGEEVVKEVAKKRDIKEIVSASGKIFPVKEIKISSDVSGEVVDLFVEEGDSVKIGKVLAKIDPDAYQSAVERAEASVNNAKAQKANSTAGIERAKGSLVQAEAQKEQIEAQLENSKAIHDRNIQLHKEGIISAADFENSLSNLKALEANLKSATANVSTARASLESSKQSENASAFTVKSAEASLKEMKTNLNRTTLVAPNSGIISMLNVEKGERVVGTAQMAGTELMRIANLDAMEVQVDVSENDVLRVSLGDAVEVEVDAYMDRKFMGKVTQIANSASNSGTGALTTDQVTNFVVKIGIDANSYQELVQPGKPFPFRPGMSASVEINTHTAKDVLSVPIQAVTTREDSKREDESAEDQAPEEKDNNDKIKEVVFLYNGGVAKMMEVKTGIQDDNYIEILEGLNDGDDVVTGPYSAVARKLEDDMELRLQDKKNKEKKWGLSVSTSN